VSLNAGDSPEMRKNTGLYLELQGAPIGAAGRNLRRKPEVLAPAGGWEQAKAAVESGADAVYFGLSDLNARARAANFDPGEELCELMEYLHSNGVKGYVTINVLVFNNELKTVEARVRQMARAGVDAVIVQDLGVVELIRKVAPNLPIHGSTQMTITSAEGVEFAADQGVTRVVVARELSVPEIGKITGAATGIAEVECFVHGALCVSYSGQCFSSEAWGGRSANRGQCAQACRMPYGLIVDGILREMGDVKYLLSPQDLMAVEQVPALIEAGVSCFKIEGRLKGADYVSITTQVTLSLYDKNLHASIHKVNKRYILYYMKIKIKNLLVVHKNKTPRNLCPKTCNL
jgi:collagenase-like PrtC family protease